MNPVRMGKTGSMYRHAVQDLCANQDPRGSSVTEARGCCVLWYDKLLTRSVPACTVRQNIRLASHGQAYQPIRSTMATAAGSQSAFPLPRIE